MSAETIIKGPETFDAKKHNIFALTDDRQEFAQDDIHARAGAFVELRGHAERVYTQAATDVVSQQKEYVVAYIHAYEKDDEMQIHLLATDMAYKHMGYASSLIRDALADVGAQAKKPLRAIAVSAGLADAFYAKLGFEGPRDGVMRLSLTEENLKKMQGWQPHARPAFKPHMRADVKGSSELS